MNSYEVRWEIDVEEASSPRAAARQAQESQRRPGSIANAFQVRQVFYEPGAGVVGRGEWEAVDLDEPAFPLRVVQVRDGFFAVLDAEGEWISGGHEDRESAERERDHFLDLHSRGEVLKSALRAVREEGSK